MKIHHHNDVPSPSHQPNELNERLIGLPALNPFFRSVSGPRAAMFNKHLAQRPTLKNPTRQRLVTGVGYELGKYTYSISIPNNAYIVKVIPKYRPILGYDNVVKNPLKTIIYEDPETGVFDIVDLPRFHSNHQYFGFEYKLNEPLVRQIASGSRFIGDAPIADSPAKTADGDYMFGIHANIALVSDRVVIEDGIKISESFAKRCGIDLFETRTINYTPNSIGLNIYGDDNNYKLFPDIGDRIREDGIVFAVRETSDELAPADLSAKRLRQITMFDVCTYGKPGAEVIDVEIIKGDLSRPVFLTGMDDQLIEHHEAHLRYYAAIYEAYLDLRRSQRGSLRISYAFNRLVREAIAIQKSSTNKLSFKGNTKLTGWTVKVTYKYSIAPKQAFKLTNLAGGKGVVCHVVPDECMPINSIGIRADMLMDQQAPYRRTIMSSPQEIYINACLDKVIYDIKQITKDGSDESKERAYDFVLGFYKIVSPPMYEVMVSNQLDKIKHIDEILKGNVSVWLPPDNPVNYMEVVELLQQYYPPVKEKVKFKSESTGEMIETKSEILIGGTYTILLDKIATDNGAVASAKIQHFGIPSKINKTNKHHSPFRLQPTKSLSEDDTRMLEGIIGGRITADLLDQTNNPEVHKTILNSIYSTDKPSSLEKLVDRKLQPTGHGSIQNMTNNILACVGIEITKGRKK